MDQETTAPVLSVTEAYELIERGDFVALQYAGGASVDVLVDGVLWLSGHHKPLQIVSSRGRRYALGGNDKLVWKERCRGF
jgi:hypothetical protein